MRTCLTGVEARSSEKCSCSKGTMRVSTPALRATRPAKGHASSTGTQVGGRSAKADEPGHAEQPAAHSPGSRACNDQLELGAADEVPVSRGRPWPQRDGVARRPRPQEGHKHIVSVGDPAPPFEAYGTGYQRRAERAGDQQVKIGQKHAVGIESAGGNGSGARRQTPSTPRHTAATLTTRTVPRKLG